MAMPNGATSVITASRSSGGVSITLILLMPDRDIWSVRGMGVALSASTSTPSLRSFSFSFCLTPKRCSSSITSSPRSWKRVSFLKREWVDMTMSTSPLASLASTSLRRAGVLKRLMLSMVTGNAEKRCLKTLSCCSHKSVVGTSTATCLPW